MVKIKKLTIQERERTIAIIRKRINKHTVDWRKHLKDEGGSCYCMASHESCIPEITGELEDLIKEIVRNE